jgi:hypothetical protein
MRQLCTFKDCDCSTGLMAGNVVQHIVCSFHKTSASGYLCMSLYSHLSDSTDFSSFWNSVRTSKGPLLHHNGSRYNFRNSGETAIFCPYYVIPSWCTALRHPCHHVPISNASVERWLYCRLHNPIAGFSCPRIVGCRVRFLDVLLQPLGSCCPE